jgi:nucleotide-binding universal stress UspA family protein
VAGIRAAGAEVAGTVLAQGPAAEVILDVAVDLGAGLILMGSRGRGGVRRVVMGSASEGVVHHATVPVLVMRGEAAAWPPRHVVAGDDGSPGAMEALRLAAEIAGLFGSRVTVVRALPHLQDTLAGDGAPEAHVLDDVLEFAQAELEDHAAALSPDVAARTTLHVSVEDPAQALLATAAEDSGEALLAVGCRGLGALQRMRFGSVSTKVLRAAHGPVLIAPHAAVVEAVPGKQSLHVVAG